MKILQINSVCGVTGTGRIVADLYQAATEKGHDCRIAYGEHKFQNDPGNMQTWEIGTLRDCQLHAVLTRLFDMHGFGSRKATLQFLKKVDEFQPDIIHLHNLHGYYINIELLFQFLKQCNAKVLWTLHDCWPFTGHCVYFQNARCEKWKNCCHTCPQTTQYPASLVIDHSKTNYQRKKMLFTGLEKTTIIVPSKWMEQKVRQSFLQNYDIKVIYNGINLKIYQPTENDFRNRYHLNHRFIILGVANIWTERKGLNTFLKLAEMLGNEYQIVLVGLTPAQIEQLPGNILGLPRTDSVEELAQIYTAADVFVNPGKEETFGLNVAEAMACGTWPIVYTGTACAEVVELGTGQIVSGDITELRTAIQMCREQGTITNIEAYAKFLSRERFTHEVLQLYENT